MALRVVEPVEEISDPVCAFLASVLDEVGLLVADRLGGVAEDVTEAVRVDRLGCREQLVATTAGQASEIVGAGHGCSVSRPRTSIRATSAEVWPKRSGWPAGSPRRSRPGACRRPVPGGPTCRTSTPP